MKKYLPALLAFVLLFGLSIAVVHAQTPDVGGGNPRPDVGGSNPSSGGGVIKIPNPFRTGGSLLDFFMAIVNGIIIPIGQIVAVCAFIYTGFLFVTAQGSDSKLKDAKSAFLNSVIGTAILLGAWVIARVIEGTINQFSV
jgi:hypothetical protein